MKSPLLKRMAVLMAASFLYTKQALAAIFAIPFVYMAVSGAIVLGSAVFGSLYLADQNELPVKSMDFHVDEPVTENLPENIDENSTINVMVQPPDDGGSKTSTSICDYETPALVGPYSQYIGQSAYTEMVDSIIVREVGSTAEAPRSPDIEKWIFDAGQNLSVEPGAVFGFYQVNLPYAMSIAQVDSLISKMRLSDTTNWPKGKGCQYSSIEPNRKSVPNASGFEYLMPREPSNPNSANFNGAWKKINEWMGPQMPQDGNVVSSDGGAVANKGPKIALNRVDIAVIDSGFSSLNDVQKYDGYYVDDLFTVDSQAFPTSAVFSTFNQLAKLKPVDRTEGVTGSAKRHGSMVTYVLARSLRLIDPHLKNSPYSPDDSKLSINNNFHIHQYTASLNFSQAFAIEDIIRKKYKLINKSLGFSVDLSSEGIKKLRSARGALYDEIFKSMSPLAYSTGEELRKNGVLLVNSSGNDALTINTGIILSRNVLVAGSTQGDVATLSISPNPSFVVATVDDIFVKTGEAISGVVAGEKVGGTSYSAPQVTAVAAMMMAVNPKLTADQIREGIICSARQSGLRRNTQYDPSIDSSGYMLPEAGVLDALGAINLAIASMQSIDLTDIKLDCKNKANSQEKNACCVIF